MAVSAAKAKRKNGTASANENRKKAAKAAKEMNPNTILSEIENDPNAPPIAKGLVALRRKRDQSGEPYITIEQMWKELERE
ncbi:MAG TPA: hypothetical protein PKC13_04070 [Blastocatellia bacterium]|nr:hypothetical protein [Blastocatellia bacterium]